MLFVSKPVDRSVVPLERPWHRRRWVLALRLAWRLVSAVRRSLRRSLFGERSALWR